MCIITPLIQYKDKAKLQKYNKIFLLLYVLMSVFIAYKGINGIWYSSFSIVWYMSTYFFVAFVLTFPTKQYIIKFQEIIQKISSMMLSFYGLHIIAMTLARYLVRIFGNGYPVVIQGLWILGLSIIIAMILTIIEQCITHKIGLPMINKIERVLKLDWLQ